MSLIQSLTIPESFKNDKTLTDIFREHYQTGYEVREKEEIERNLATGQEHGYNLLMDESVNIDSKFIDYYEKGFNEGKLKRKEEVMDEGYQSAFIEVDYKESETLKDNQELITWFKEGYDSNTTAIKIKESAFENGYNNSDYFIPEEFENNEHAIALYDRLFEDGKKLRKDEQSAKNTTVALSILLPVSGIALGGGYVYRRRKKQSQ